MRGATYTDKNEALARYNFYSHAPCGARRNTTINSGIIIKFLLTRPMRGATYEKDARGGTRYNFYSHAPCGARHWK